MKTFRLISFVILPILLACSHKTIQQPAIFVSPQGRDTWSGRLAVPNKSRSDGPFRSLERARKAVRALKSSGKWPSSGVTVYLRQGTYSISKSLRLEKRDSGVPGAPVVWKAYPHEKVLFSGGKKLTGFHKVSDSWALTHLQPQVRDNVFEVDLKKAGIDSVPPRVHRGNTFRPNKPLEMELFFNGKAMTLARYPNSGWLKISSVPQFGKLVYAGNARQKRFGIPTGRHYGRFQISNARVRRWQPDERVWMHGYFTWDWADTYEKAAKIDPRNLLVYPAPPYNRYGYTKGQRFYFYNILAELDSAGEYYIDPKRDRLYFYPPSDLGSGQAVLSVLNSPFIVIRNAQHLQFEGIRFAYSRTEAIDAKNSSEIRIAGCSFRNVGDPAVNLNGGVKNRVVSCNFCDLAGAGVYLFSGNRQTLSPGKSVVTNSLFCRFGRVYRTYAPAIYLFGVGDTLSHNLLHDAPHMAILFQGNEHRIEYNNVYDIAKETGDVGAIYIGRDWTWRGNMVRYNFIHDLHGPGLYGVRGVYFDDFTSGNTIYGNIFYRAGKAAFIGGGRDNRIENNVFVACFPSVHVDARGTSWAHNYFTPGTSDYVSTLFDRLQAVHYDQPPYSRRYPELLHYLADQPDVPKNNVVVRNVSFGGRFLDLWDGLDLSVVKVKNNFIADSVLLQWSQHTDQTTKFVRYSIDDSTIRQKMAGNVFGKGNPGIYGFKTGKIHIDRTSKIWTIGFKPIPVDKIGLYKDRYRRELAEVK